MVVGDYKYGLYYRFVVVSQTTWFNFGNFRSNDLIIPFLTVKITHSAIYYAKLYRQDIIRLYGLLVSIILDRGE